jgi:hypothetical protein
MGRPRIQLSVGQRFGRLVVKESAGGALGGDASWLCDCDCGSSLVVRGFAMRSGNTKSCGCLKRETSRAALFKHGHSDTPGKKPASAEYQSWRGMISRCELPNHKAFPAYGARGIRVCDRWRRDFTAFLEDMGPKPSRQHSIDRIDNSGHYEPDNCRWATQKEQCRNTRRNRRVTHNGETLTLAEWEERTGIPQSRIWNRMLEMGWTPEEALTTPVRAMKRRSEWA